VTNAASNLFPVRTHARRLGCRRQRLRLAHKRRPEDGPNDNDQTAGVPRLLRRPQGHLSQHRHLQQGKGGWAFSNPIRKVYYNITVTSLSVAVALLIGTIELLQVAATKFGLESGFWSFLNKLDFGKIGYGLVSLFILTWLASVIVWKTCRIEQRWNAYIVD
jgi:hypothetical protein